MGIERLEVLSYGLPDSQGDVFEPGCFAESDGKSVPVTLNFDPRSIMTIEQVRARVEEIRAKSAHLDGSAHVLADRLHNDVLKAIAEGSVMAMDLAKEALRTNEIEFNRWYE